MAHQCDETSNVVEHDAQLQFDEPSFNIIYNMWLIIFGITSSTRSCSQQGIHYTRYGVL